MQKKISIVVIAIVLFLSGCSYYYRSNQMEPMVTPVPTIPPAHNNNSEFTEKITYYPAMVENDNFDLPKVICECDMASIALESIEQGDSYVSINYSIIGKSEYAIDFSVQSLCINGYMISNFEERFFHTEVPEDEIVMTESSIPLSELESLNIKSIEEISLYYSISNHENNINHVDTYTISTGNDYETYQLPEDSKLIAQNDDIDVCLIDMYGDEYYEKIDLIVINKTDERIFFGISGIALDGISTSAHISEDLLPKSVYKFTMAIPHEYATMLEDIEETAIIELLMHINKADAESSYYKLSQNYVLNEENIKNREPYDGQIVMDKNDMLIGIKRIYGDDGICTTLEMYIENNTDEDLYFEIKNVLMEKRVLDANAGISATLSGTCSSYIIDLKGSLPEQEYNMTMTVDVFDAEYNGEKETAELSFVLE